MLTCIFYRKGYESWQFKISQMASLIPGYEYDIFISYRHQDNNYGGWVTEFVANLKKAWGDFKNDVYNPHDKSKEKGLLIHFQPNARETHEMKC